MVKRKLTQSCFFSVFLFSTGWLGASESRAAILYESGTLGPTGIDLSYGEVPGTFVKDTVFTGVKFRVERPVQTTYVGGHFASVDGGGFGYGGTFFGSLIRLEDADDYPDSGDLSTPDVLGTTILTFPGLSAEVFGVIEVHLAPGWYALVFGSHLFGANGHGGAPRNNPDVGNPTYIGWQPGSGWFDLTGLSTIFVDHRFIVLGDVVPEPTSAVMVFLIAFSLFHRNTARSG